MALQPVSNYSNRMARASALLFNARPHAAHIVTEYLNYVNIQVLEWPSCSLDLNLIKHLWDITERRVRSQHPQPNSLDDLRQSLIRVWEGISQETIRSLIESMPRRCQATMSASDPYEPEAIRLNQMFEEEDPYHDSDDDYGSDRNYVPSGSSDSVASSSELLEEPKELQPLI
ncbi:hypothetical protein ILUMI_05084 [Ignelater luminosus]|uniref:Tc1-like transposase DDE domain-containing protein n=1 Tax=Ignelater luminosus TaxID=2038154 RepID=A0A8K0DDK9_IGNLU|nr:hypothetical protein ILUMI_05084 [Ignelater luminosus]